MQECITENLRRYYFADDQMILFAEQNKPKQPEVVCEVLPNSNASSL